MAETSDLGFEDPSFAEQVPHENGAVDGGANGALDADMFSSGASPPEENAGAAFDPADFSEPAGEPASNGTAGYTNASGVSSMRIGWIPDCSPTCAHSSYAIWFCSDLLPLVLHLLRHDAL
mmetsp:Transcript_18766/g.56762  ORF Transcript_18766/g.56762 Transcript_18766/m.56762 type:complete len:121 (+) Transcript_18766:130-492(+)